MIKLMLLPLLSLLIFSSVASGQSAASCNQLNDLIKSTYDFKPSKLSEAQQTVKSKEMDKVWDAVKAKPKEMLPCLRQALRAPDANAWFIFDGSELLLSLDPSAESKAFEVSALNKVDLADIDTKMFVGLVTKRAVEGYDMSEA